MNLNSLPQTGNACAKGRILALPLLLLLTACAETPQPGVTESATEIPVLTPVVVTEQTSVVRSQQAPGLPRYGGTYPSMSNPILP